MADKRVVYPIYMLDAPVFGKKFWSMMDQLITSMTSYFVAGNTVPVLVGTDSTEVKAIVEQVARHYGYPVDVVRERPSVIAETAGKYAEPICRNRISECRLDVVTSKIYTMLKVGVEYDRLVVDIDTLWFKPVPWEQFENSGMAMFCPDQWKHLMSVTIGQMVHFRSKYMEKLSIQEYYSKLSNLDPAWRTLPLIATFPWPNSGILFMTSEFTKEKYIPELDNPALGMLSVEDETPLVSLLLKGGKYFTDIQMNVPVAFTDITMEKDILHPEGIICAHYHRTPKPDAFDITYSGVVKHPALHEPYDLVFIRDSIACSQYGSMSGILWCYVWRYYFSYAAAQYRNGEETPVYKQDFWAGIIKTYYENRQVWLESRETEKILTRMPK